MSLSIRMERVRQVQSAQKRLWKFRVSATDLSFAPRVLQELGFHNIRHGTAMVGEDGKSFTTSWPGGKGERRSA